MWHQVEIVKLSTNHMHFYYHLIQACMCKSDLQIVTFSVRVM